jgi:hypothetical protein
MSFHITYLLAGNVLRFGDVADFGALHGQPTTNVDLKNCTSIYHCTRHYAKPLLNQHLR